ncbi:MAG TPA: amidohydrolase family protein [Acidimicrobiales bacterium]|nr:amidohydrolase family protein [Acidimicrobiales bacterium]
MGPASDLLRHLPLVDGHCHFLLDGAPEDLGLYLTEARAPGWDAPAGLAVRRWCAPALDLPALASAEDYLARRAELGHDQVTSRLLRAAGLSDLLVDTGLRGPRLVPPAPAGAAVHEVVRLERVAEDLAATGVTPADFASAYVERLGVACAGAVATKSIAAYRHGLDLDPARPAPAEVEAAAGEWLAAPSPRLDHPVLLRFVLWAGADQGLPVQVHAGFGDRDLTLRGADPALLQPWLAAVDVPVVLLHCWPYHRQAGWLACVYPHVYVDVGLTVAQVGAAAGAVLGEFVEVAPMTKVLFSTDGYRLPELYLAGAAQFRHSLGQLLDGWVADGAFAGDDAERAAALIGGENARRVYRRLRGQG